MSACSTRRASRGGLGWLERFEKCAQAGRERLGLDPRSHAELLRQRVEAQRSAVDLDGLRARAPRSSKGALRAFRNAQETTKSHEQLPCLDLLAALVLEDGRRWGEAAEPWQWADIVPMGRRHVKTGTMKLVRELGRRVGLEYATVLRYRAAASA